ncbi:MAG: hypothetical protein ACFB9N_18990 [Geitlerinemataceae cyanobacterium]
MDAVLNFHAIDPNNLGDFLSSPFEYFDFPGYRTERLDILEFETYLTEPARVSELRDTLDDVRKSCKRLHVVLGGGGLLAPRFEKAVAALRDRIAKPSGGTIVTWGVGQQSYGVGNVGQRVDRDDPKVAKQIAEFPYERYVADWDRVGVRDVGYGLNLEWLPCASCMHPAFERKRAIERDFVVYSHAKYELSLPGIPELSHTESSLDRVLDFLGSAETVITSSYHGAYWATLLGRKVLAFPFTSKFLTLQHPVGLYPTPNWKQPGIYWRPFTKTFLNKFRVDIKFSERFRCQPDDWRSHTRDLPSHPEALRECRDRNRAFHESFCAAIDAIV